MNIENVDFADLTVDQIRDIVKRGTRAYEKMLEIGEGVGGLGVRDSEALAEWDAYNNLFDMEYGYQWIFPLLDELENLRIRVASIAELATS